MFDAPLPFPLPVVVAGTIMAFIVGMPCGYLVFRFVIPWLRGDAR